MNKLKLMVAALAVSSAILTFADDYWDTSKHVDAAPVSSSPGQCAGLFAKARGIDGSAGDAEIDPWHMSWFFSNECWIKWTPPRGMMIIVK